MSTNNVPETDEPHESADSSGGSQKPVVPWPKWKTAVLIVIALAAIGLTVNSSIRYEAAHQSTATVQNPPPTYTGEAPLPITSISQAWNSNNDFVLVFTPCAEPTLNTSILNVTIQAADKIRSTDGIYVGVFTLPANASLNYPTLTIRLFNTTASLQETMTSGITADSIYNAYLDRKFLRQ